MDDIDYEMVIQKTLEWDENPIDDIEKMFEAV